MIRVKRGVKENIPILTEGEPGYVTDDREFWVGGAGRNRRADFPAVYPEEYGAKGDGTTDDTTAIQAAVNTRRPVMFSRDYIISDTITLPENAILLGAMPPIDYRTLARFEVAGTITINVSDKDIFKLDQTDLYLGYIWSIKISNLKLVGTGASVSGAGINFANAAMCEVRNVTIDQTYDGIYIDTGMTNTYNDMNISRCANSCVYIAAGGVTTSQTFNGVIMRESPYAIINRATTANYTINTIYNDCLIESTTVGGVYLEKGAAATFNNLYAENVPNTAMVDGCIFECGLTGTGPTSYSILNMNGGNISGGYNAASSGNIIFRTFDYFLININGGRYGGAYHFHEQTPGYAQLCSVNLDGVFCSGSDLYEVFDSSISLHGSFLDGSLPNEERFRTKLPTILNLEVNSITSGSIDARILEFTNLSVAVTNGGFDSNTTGWNATRATLASVAGGQAGNCLEITYTTGPTNSAADRLVTGLVPGITYTISSYVKSGTSGAGAYQFVVYPKIVNVPLVTVAGTSSGAWVEDSDTFVNPAGNSDVNIYLIKNNVDAGTMLFDTVTITAVAPTAPTDGFIAYSDDIAAGNAAPHFRTENGTIIKLDQAIDKAATPTFKSALVGDWPFLTSYAIFGNAALDNTTVATNYGVLQDNVGNTYINASNGRRVYVRINNVTVLAVNGANVGFGGDINPAEVVDVTGNTNVTGVYKVADVPVVGARRASTPPPSGGTVIDAEARAAIASILLVLEGHGLTGTVRSGAGTIASVSTLTGAGTIT